MSKPTKIQLLAVELEDEAQDNPDDYRWKAAAELRQFEAENLRLVGENAELLKKLTMAELQLAKLAQNGASVADDLLQNTSLWLPAPQPEQRDPAPSNNGSAERGPRC